MAGAHSAVIEYSSRCGADVLPACFLISRIEVNTVQLALRRDLDQFRPGMNRGGGMDRFPTDF